MNKEEERSILTVHLLAPELCTTGGFECEQIQDGKELAPNLYFGFYSSH